MGIVTAELSSFQLESGDEYTIEYNESGKIHIHIDDIRLGMTPEEFRTLVQLSSEAHERLMKIKSDE